MGLFDMFKKKPETKQVVKTFTCHIAGIGFPCQFPARKSQTRKAVFICAKEGDECYLKTYEWEGKPAIAVMHTGANEDLGVIPEKMVSQVLALCEKYDISVHLQNKHPYEIDGKQYHGGDVHILCFEKKA